MPIIRLPDHLRDGIISGLGNHIGRKVEKGHAVAIFTYRHSESGEYEYTVDFKNTENAKTLGPVYIQNITRETHLDKMHDKS